MKIRQSFNAFKQTSNHLILLLVLTTNTSGCQAKDQKMETFIPLFDGLTAGHYSKETGCVTVNGLSAKLDIEEFEQLLQVFSKPDCKTDSFLYKKTLSIESQIAGIWNNHLVIDEGNDANSREFHLLSMSDKSITHSFYYVLMPEFKETSISYLHPLEITAQANQCSADQKQPLKEWQRLEFELELAEEKIFDVLSGKTSTTRIKKCFPLQ